MKIFRIFFVLISIFFCGQLQAQAYYFDACIDVNPNGYLICRLKPDWYTKWGYDSGYGIAPRDEGSAYSTEAKAVQETLNYFIYSNPNFSQMCAISHSLGDSVVRGSDEFIMSREPVWKSKVLHITYGWINGGRCERIGTSPIEIWAQRIPQCNHSRSGSQGFWAGDIKSYMCVNPADETPPPCNMCSTSLRGNPLLVPTREKVESIVDLRDEGPMFLEFRRTYRSHRARDKALWFMGYYSGESIGVVGDGWIHNYDVRLTIAQRILTEDAAIEQIRIQMGDGTFHHFYRNGAALRYESRSRLHALTKQTVGWIFEDAELGIKYVFNGKGLLERQVLRNGWSLNYNYDSEGRLEMVTNHFG
ncbi:MAG: DUF6531 domain-containing protein [Burkholderiaceae bacterium]